MRKWRRRAVLAAAACLALAAVLAVVVHAPPVRRAVLRRVVSVLADRYDLAFQADALRYDLLRRRVTLTGVEIAARAAPQPPFFTADLIEITVPSSVFAGRVAVDRIHLGAAAVHIRRRADGTLNLPAGGEASGGEPAPLPVARLDAERLTVRLEDESQALSLLLPALAFDIDRSAGALRMTEPGSLSRGSVTTTIDALGGKVTFDGRAMALNGFEVEADAVTARVEGSVTLIADDPGVDLRVSGTADARALTRWTGVDAPEGELTFDGTVIGPFASPLAMLRVRGQRLAWRSAVLTGFDASADIDDRGIRLQHLSGGILDGKVTASGEIGVGESGSTTLALSWSGIDVRALARLAGAVPRVPPAGRATGSAQLRGAGGDLAGWTIDARTGIAPAVGPAGAVAIGGTSELRVDRGAWRLTADHRVADVLVHARLSGRLNPDRLAASTVDGAVSIDETSMSALIGLLRAAELIDNGPEEAVAGRVRAEAMLSGTWEHPHLAVKATGEGMSAGSVSGIAADVDAIGTLAEMAVAGRVRHAGANIVDVAGTVFPRDGRVEARLAGRLDDPAALDVPVQGRVEFAFDVTGPFSAPAARGRVAVADATYERLQLGTVAADVEATRDAVHVEFAAPQLGARGRVTLALADARRAAVQLDAEDADLGRLLRGRELPVAVEGRVRLRAEGEAPLDDWRAGRGSIELTSLQGTIGDLRLRLGGPAHVVYSDDVLHVERLDVEAGELRLFVTGRLPASEGAAPVAAADALRALVTGDVADVLAAARAAGVADVPEGSGRGSIAVVARVTGSVMRPQVTADLDVAGGEVTLRDLPPVRAINARARVADGWIRPLILSGEWQESRLRVEGGIPLRLLEGYLPDASIAALPPTEGPAVISARAQSITPLVLAPFVEAAALTQIEGVVDASADIEIAAPDVTAVRGEARLDRLDLRIAGLPVTQQQPTRVTFADGFAHVSGWDWIGQGATLQVQGQVRLADGEAALLSAGRLDLRLLTPFVRDAGLSVAGTLAPRVALSGPIASPHVDGEVVLSGGEMRLREPRVVATRVAAYAALEPRRIRITNITGTVNGGALAAAGAVSYGTGEAAAANIAGTITGMGLELPDGLRSELNVDVAVTLTDAAAGVGGSVTGTISLLRSAYREPTAVAAGLLAALRAERLAPGAPAADTLAQRMALDLRLLTDADIIVDNNLARLELGGDLRVIGTAAAPALSGRATLREGGQLFLGRNVYTIASGTIDFADPLTIQPDLNVEASTRAGGDDIALTLSGTPDALAIDLRSDTRPNLGQADVAALLLTGRTLDEVAGDEAEIVGEQVLGYLSGDVLGLAGRALGLDTIRLGGLEGAGLRRDPSAVAAETNPTSRLTFGKSIGRDVDLTYSQSLREGGAQTWIVDYQPLRQVNLRLVARDDDLRSYEFRHDLSFGGSERRSSAERPLRSGEVAAVVITGDLPLDEPELRRVLRVQPGDRFDFADWQRDRDRLEERLRADGRFEARVGAERADDNGGVVLTYEVTAGPRTVVTMAGYTASPALRGRLADAWAQSVFDDFLEEEAADIVRAALAADGYIEAAVTAEVSGQDPKTLALTVAPGPRALSRRVELAIDDDDGLAQDLAAWVRRTRMDDWSSPQAVESALAGELRSRGHLRARITIGEARIDGADAVLPATVAAGPVFTLATVTFDGVRHLPPERLAEIAGVAEGDLYDPAAIEAARARIEAAYRRAAFTAARASVEAAVAAAAATVRVVFRIDEGPRQVLREVSLRGNRGIDGTVIRRALDLTVGEPLAADAWLQARARLFDTGLFRRVDVTTEPIETAAAGDEERPTRVIVTVEEWPALRVRYGLQISEQRPEAEVGGRVLTPGLSADVTRRTLFGRAVSVTTAAEYQRRERLARIVMNAPTLFGMPLESLLTAERSRRNYADAAFVTDRGGISWEQRLRLGQSVQVSYAYRFDRDHTFQATIPDDPFFIPFDVTANVARLTASAVFDTRDDPTDATRGWLLSSNLEAAPESLGSDFQFLRHIGQAHHFRKAGAVVFGSAAQIGTVAPRGGQVLLPSELFFGGGAGTVRGVAEDTLGPADFVGDPAGGRAMVVLNQEVRFPIAGWLRGVAFLDAGNVFETPGAIDVRRFVTSIGAGVRVDTPFALLRADWAQPVSSRPDHARTVRWTFGIGHTF